MPLPLLIPLLAAGAAGISSIASGVLQAKANKEAQDKTIKENRYLSNLAYSRDVEMWNRQNEYNSPESQMKRLESAGLNPNLVYGTGAVGNQTGAPPSYTPPREEYRPLVNFPEILSTYQNLKLQSMDVKLKEQAFRNAQLDGDSKSINNLFLEQMLKENLLKTKRESQVTLLRTDTESQKASRLKQLIDKEDFSRDQGRWQSDVERSIYDSRMAKLNYSFASQLRPYGLKDTDNLLFRWLATNLDKIKSIPLKMRNR